ncbi:MAG: hypothetical protein KAI72_01540 [Candidatus Pacebacteria bacterium]|nr:hypothetical protein [Candidatus Paceibacterota bacterium]
MKIKMTWNKANQKWLMTVRGFFVFDFWNCGTLNTVFKGLDKKNPKEYDVIIKPSK